MKKAIQAQPVKRLPIPRSLSVVHCFRTLENMLRNSARKFKAIKKINIAYPYKHPDLFPGHYNRGKDAAELLLARLQRTHKNVTMFDGICETQQLKRSTKHDSLFHTLSLRQAFAAYGENKIKGEHFILVDHTLKHGSTVADMASYIRKNGGHVLAVAANTGYAEDFCPARETRHALLKEFARNASGLSVLQCARQFNKAIAPYGLSLRSMTSGETRLTTHEMTAHLRDNKDAFERLLKRVRIHPLDIIRRLTMKAPA